jgi:uncharacterized protein YutE (UPF0331/DUF86 family)
MSFDDVVINKTNLIRHALVRIREEYSDGPEALLADQTKLEAVLLNIQRAVDSSIDLAMHITRREKLGVPQSSREAFELIQKHGVISPPILAKVKRMVGFRNIAVHNYVALEFEVIKKILAQHLVDFEQFLGEVLTYESKRGKI